MKSITTLIQNERPLTVFVLPKKTEQGKWGDRETDCTLSPPLTRKLWSSFDLHRSCFAVLKTIPCSLQPLHLVPFVMSMSEEEGNREAAYYQTYALKYQGKIWLYCIYLLCTCLAEPSIRVLISVSSQGKKWSAGCYCWRWCKSVRLFL